MNEVRIAVSTAGSLEEAQRLARALVEERLAACVNLVPQVQSIYRWQGQVEEAAEILLLIKTTTDCLESLESTLRLLHSYEIPEFVVLGIDSGSPAYLNWVLESVQPPHGSSKSG